jgi:hypothetical protein
MHTSTPTRESVFPNGVSRRSIWRSTLFVSNCLFLILFCAQSAGTTFGTGTDWTAIVAQARMVAVTRQGSGLCNSVAFSQIPGHRDLFVGRLKENTGPDGCSGDNWALALFEMNWKDSELRFVRYLLRPPFPIPGDDRVIQSVYDPYAVGFKGEVWVAFECAAPGSVSSCIGPLDLDRGIPVNRVSAPASGGPESKSDAWSVSASDPKLLVFRGHLYLYWTVIRSDEHRWIDGTTRGVELIEDDSPQKRLWAKNAVGRRMRANDTQLTAEVWSPTANDALSNSIADVFGVYTAGNAIFAVAGLGGSGKAPGEECLTPEGNSFGCFRLAISRASEPLESHAFNGSSVHAVGFPGNPQEYSRIIEGPDGGLFMMGAYLDPPERYAAQYQGHTLRRGLFLYPISVR